MILPIPLSSSDYSSIVTASTFLASFQSPFSTFIGERKGSRSYFFPALSSFMLLLASVVLAIVENDVSLVLLVLGAAFAVLTYLFMMLEDSYVQKYSERLAGRK
jgi:MFS family permease